MEYSALSKIASLKLDDNRLTGTLPPLWKALTNLRELRLNKNSLSGTIPCVPSPHVSSLDGPLDAWLIFYH